MICGIPIAKDLKSIIDKFDERWYKNEIKNDTNSHKPK